MSDFDTLVATLNKLASERAIAERERERALRSLEVAEAHLHSTNALLCNARRDLLAYVESHPVQTT